MVKPKFLAIHPGLRQPEALYFSSFGKFKVTLVGTKPKVEWVKKELGDLTGSTRLVGLAVRLRGPVGLRGLATFDELDDLVKSHDLIETYTLSTSFSAQVARLARKHKKPLVVSVWATFNNPWIKLPPYCWWTRQVLEEASLFIARTRRSQKLLLKLRVPRSKIIQQYMSPDPRFFYSEGAEEKSKRARKQLTVLYSGQLVASKGVLRLMKAFRQLAPRYPHLKLQIAGFGPLEKEVRLHTIQHPNMEFIDKLPYNLMGNLYRQAGIFCSPDSDFKIGPIKVWEEMVPWTFREAAACGRPIITGDWLADEGLGDIALAAGEKGVTDPLQATLEYLAANKDLRADLGRRARRWARQSLNLQQEVSDITQRFFELL